MLAELDEHGLTELFDRAARFAIERPTKEEHVIKSTPVSCPPGIAKHYLARKGIGWRVPVLNGIDPYADAAAGWFAA